MRACRRWRCAVGLRTAHAPDAARRLRSAARARRRRRRRPAVHAPPPAPPPTATGLGEVLLSDRRARSWGVLGDHGRQRREGPESRGGLRWPRQTPVEQRLTGLGVQGRGVQRAPQGVGVGLRCHAAVVQDRTRPLQHLLGDLATRLLRSSQTRRVQPRHRAPLCTSQRLTRLAQSLQTSTLLSGELVERPRSQRRPAQRRDRCGAVPLPGSTQRRGELVAGASELARRQREELIDALVDRHAHPISLRCALAFPEPDCSRYGARFIGETEAPMALIEHTTSERMSREAAAGRLRQLADESRPAQRGHLRARRSRGHRGGARRHRVHPRDRAWRGQRAGDRDRLVTVSTRGGLPRG